MATYRFDVVRDGRTPRLRQLGSPARSRQRGQTMVEAALVSILFLTVIFGIIGFGQLVWAYSWTSHSAREASRWASVRGAKSGYAGNPTLTAFVKSNMMALNPNHVTVNGPFWFPDNNPGSAVQVTVRYQVDSIVPFVPTMTVQSSSTMTISQ